MPTLKKSKQAEPHVDDVQALAEWLHEMTARECYGRPDRKEWADVPDKAKEIYVGI